MFSFANCRGLDVDDQGDFEDSLPRGWSLREGGAQVWRSGDVFFEAKLILDGPPGRCAVARSGACPTREDACLAAIHAVPAAIGLEPRITQLRAEQALEKERAAVAAQAAMLEAGVLRVPARLAPTGGTLCASADGDHVILTQRAVTAEQAAKEWRQAEALAKQRQQPHHQRVEQLATEISRLGSGAKEALVERLRGAPL